MSHISVFESDFGSYYIGPHLEQFLLRARQITLPKWLPGFVQSWLWPVDYKILMKGWDFHEQMEAIALRKWEADEDTTGIFEIGKRGKIVVTEPQELEFYYATQ